MPVSAERGVLRLCMELGVAFADVTRAEVAVLSFRPRPTANAVHALGRLARFALAPSLFLVAPRTRACLDPATCISVTAERYPYLLVDLSGLRERGDHLAAIDLLDGVALVAHSGLASERDLLQRSDELPPSQNLGVLLVGAQVTAE
jgi:hypothetical protein